MANHIQLIHWLGMNLENWFATWLQLEISYLNPTGNILLEPSNVDKILRWNHLVKKRYGLETFCGDWAFWWCLVKSPEHTIGHVNIGIISLCIGNSQWYLYNIHSKSNRLLNTQSSVLQADWVILENDEKVTLNINMPYWLCITQNNIPWSWELKTHFSFWDFVIAGIQIVSLCYVMWLCLQPII